MKLNKIIKLAISIIICELAGVVGSTFTTPAIGNWFKDLNKPSFNPPNWVFGPVWSILFLLIGISLYIVWDKKWKVENEIIDLIKIEKIKKIKNSILRDIYSVHRKLWSGSWQKLNIVSIFFIQLGLNVRWSMVFFGEHSVGSAFFVLLMLWFAILFTIVNFYRVSKLAAYLLLPYILWVTYAGVLSYFFWILN